MFLILLCLSLQILLLPELVLHFLSQQLLSQQVLLILASTGTPVLITTTHSSTNTVATSTNNTRPLHCIPTDIAADTTSNSFLL